MKIYFFTVRGMFVYAGVKYKGIRNLNMIWSQAGRNYCSFGAKITNNHEIVFFTDEQEAAFKKFCESDKLNEEFWEGI